MPVTNANGFESQWNIGQIYIIDLTTFLNEDISVTILYITRSTYSYEFVARTM